MSFTNTQGEPIMDGAAYRFEGELDSYYASERAYGDAEDGYYSAVDHEPPAGYVHFFSTQDVRDVETGVLIAWTHVRVERDGETIEAELPLAEAEARYGRCDIN